MRNWIYSFVLIIFLCTLAMASNKIRFYSTPAEEKCIVICKTSNLYWWNTDTSAFAQSVTDANKAIDLIESSYHKGQYTATFPSSAAGNYDIICYDTNATTFDSNNTLSGGLDFSWDGSAVITDYTIKTLIDDVNDFIIAHGDVNWPSDMNDVDVQVAAEAAVVAQDVLTQAQADANFTDLKTTRGVPSID